MNKEKNIYIGCGDDTRDSFIHVDVRNLPNVDIVCNAWELSEHIDDVNHIYSRHMLEHLTDREAYHTLLNWLVALKSGGSIRVIVPDMDFHCRQWLDAKWNDETINDKWSNAKHSFASIYGWQQECDPFLDDYNPSYWSVHKSGYNKKRMQFLLSKIGFCDIKIEIKNKWHLVATAIKP